MILTRSWAISWAPDNSYHGYTYVGGAYKQYDVDKAVASTWLFGINNARHLVGSRVPLDTLVAEGFTDIGGAVTSFYGSGTDPTYAYAINSFDEVVGRYYDSSNKSHGFYRDARGTITEIAYPGATQTACVGINDAGEITGNYIDISGISHGFTDINGKFATTDFYSTAGVNNKGVFVGYYFGVRRSGVWLSGLTRILRTNQRRDSERAAELPLWRQQSRCFRRKRRRFERNAARHDDRHRHGDE